MKRADYDAYLESVRPEWDRFVRNQRLGREGKARLVDDPEATAEGQGQGGEGSSGSLQDGSEEGRVRGRKKLPPLSAVPQVFFGEEFNLGNPYTFDLVTERYKSGVTSPGAGQGGELSGYDVALNAMLQEKLSYYSDVVEQHLILEISARSTSFFAALGNLQDLSAEASGCLSRIYELREELRKVDEGQAKKGLRIVQAQSRRRGIRETERAVQAVRELVERREMVRLLVQQGEYEEALDLMDDIRSVLDSRPDVEEHEGGDMFSGAANGAEVAPALRLPSTVLEDGDEDRSGESSHDRGLYIDLTSVKSITSMRPQLVELSESIATSLQQELLSILSADITDRIERPSDDAEPKPEPTASAASGTGADSLSAPRSETDNPASPVSPTARPPASPFGNVARPLSQRDKVLRARIAPLLVGLVRTGGAERALSAYRDVALTAARGVLRTHVPAELQLAPLLEDDDAKAEQRAPATVERLRSIEHAQFLELAQKLFDVLLACIVAVDAHGKLILRALDEHNAQLLITGPTSHSSDDASNGAGPVAPIMPPGVPASLPATLADIVHSTAELAHARASRLLALRSAQHAALDLPSFLGLFQLCWSFVLRSELICRRMIVGLRGAALGQAKGFLAGFHRVRIEAAAKAVEEETWAQAEVPEPTQTEVARIVESAVEDPPAFIVVASSAEGSADSLGGARGDKVDSMARTLEIEGRNYFVVAASLHVLRLLGEYLRVVVNLPLLTTEAMGRVIEFLKVSKGWKDLRFVLLSCC